MRRDDCLPVVVGHLVDEVVADDPGAGDEDVEPSRLGRGRDRRLDVRSQRHVATHRAPADPLRGLRRCSLVEVGDDDVRALGCEPLCRRGADALRAAGDERRLPCEAAQRIIRTTSSATHTGLSPPSRSTVARTTPWSPPATSSTDCTVKVARIREPEGTGAGKRTLLTP